MTRFRWILFLLAFPAPAWADAERFELGQRLKGLETYWEQNPPEAAARERVSKVLQQSVQKFFGLRLSEAGRSLDEAYFLLRDPNGAAESARWAAALSVKPQTRLLDLKVEELGLELYEFYPAKLTAPAGAQARLTLLNSKGERIGKELVRPIGMLPLKLTLPLQGVPEGDHTLRIQILANEMVVLERSLGLSRVGFAEKRLEALGTYLEKNAGMKSVVNETIRSHRALLQNLFDGRSFETDYPAARLLAEAESLMKAQGDDVFWCRPGQFWISMPVGTRTASVRLDAPADIAKRKSIPVVLALHGAGGSENLFFEGYGAGKVVRLCRERGWLLVAPRSGGFGMSLGPLLDELAKLYPIDRERVFVVGHSMGAAAAMSALGQAPHRFTAVAALGGGGRIRRPETAKAVPVFVGCGTDDFALSMARSLARSLQAIDGFSVELKEYPDVEHLAIVQVALPDVFAFFDKVEKRR